VADKHVYRVVVARKTGKTVPQIALNWLLQRPLVATVIVGARNEEQLHQNWCSQRNDPGVSLPAPARLRPAQPASGVRSTGPTPTADPGGQPGDPDLDNPIRRSAAPVTETAVADVEAELGLHLPEAYRAFLLAHNGGVARRVTFVHTSGKGRSVETWLGWIYCVGHEGKLDPADLDLVTAYRHRPRGLPAGMLPVAQAWFAGNTGWVCVACEGPDAGKVFFRPNVDPDRDTIYPVAPRWDRFLDRLEPQDEKAKKRWKHLIQDGDADSLRQLLDTSGKWQTNHLLRSDMEADAVEEGHWSIVELLIEKGWSASELFVRALGSRRFDLARRILHTAKVSPRAVQESLTDADPLLWYIPDLAAELIALGADVDHQGSTGDSPLHRAVESGSQDGVRFLLERGANPTLRNDDGRTPAALAQRLEEPAILALLRPAEKAWQERPAPDPSTLEVAEFDFDDVPMTKAGPALALADLAAFELEIGLSLPPEYRGFLLKSNGGTPNPNRCALAPDLSPEEGRGEAAVQFSPLLPVENAGEEGHSLATMDPTKMSQAELFRLLAAAHTSRPVQSVKELHEALRQTGNPRRMLPIGTIENFGIDGGTLLISCQGRDRGRLYYRDGCLEMHAEGAEFVIDSLDALFRKLGEARSRPVTPSDLLEGAVRDGDVAAVRAALAQGADPMKPGRDGMRPVDAALFGARDEIVLVLVEAGANLDELFPQAVVHGRLDLARKLLESSKPSKKALREAMAAPGLYADPSLVKALLDRGTSATKGPASHGGWAPLHVAARAGNVDSVRLLLDAGADANTQAPGGQAPLVLAAEGIGPTQGAALIRLLLERGARVGVPDMQGETALHKVARAGNLEAAKLLIEAGEDLHARPRMTIPGMSEEQQGQMAAQAGQMMEQMMAMFGGMAAPDAGEDAPPPPDTSTPLGEHLAQAQEALRQRMAALAGKLPSLQERMREMAGSFGRGRSAAQAATDTSEGQAILPELERLDALRKKAGG
jgi:ankyrin repeat protein